MDKADFALGFLYLVVIIGFLLIGLDHKKIGDRISALEAKHGSPDEGMTDKKPLPEFIQESREEERIRNISFGNNAAARYSVPSHIGMAKYVPLPNQE